MDCTLLSTVISQSVADVCNSKYCARMISTEHAEVLITVKATPQPSAKYGDTVCVAGVRLDKGPPHWIRLYPIDFRWLSRDEQFKKYDVLSMDIRRAAGDTRSESYKPIQDSWSKLRSIPANGDWKDRQEIIGQLPHTTTCKLADDARADSSATSLGLVPVADVSKLQIVRHPPWTDEERSKMRTRIVNESGALVPSGHTPKELVAPRFLVSYHYHCLETTCKGHTGRILDWELTALQNRYAHVDDDALKSIIRHNFYEQMFASNRWPAFFMGNFELASKRQSFSVLSVYWPPLSTASSSSLF